jgi:hypothetical protein
MRLLERSSNGDFELVYFNDENPPPYAILSHTWTEGQEVTYNELVASTGKDKIGYDKIRFCSERAAADGLKYFWVDSDGVVLVPYVHASQLAICTQCGAVY